MTEWDGTSRRRNDGGRVSRACAAGRVDLRAPLSGHKVTRGGIASCPIGFGSDVPAFCRQDPSHSRSCGLTFASLLPSTLPQSLTTTMSALSRSSSGVLGSSSRLGNLCAFYSRPPTDSALSTRPTPVPDKLTFPFLPSNLPYLTLSASLSFPQTTF